MTKVNVGGGGDSAKVHHGKHAHHAQAHQGPETPAELKKDFAKADKNHDGKLSGDELNTKAGHEMHDITGDKEFNFSEGLKSMSFKGRDINHDGKLSGSELNGLDTSKYDANHDGSVDAKEYLAGHAAEQAAKHEAEQKKAFNKLDINHDGKLSGTELKGIKDAAKYEKNGELDLKGYQQAEHDQAKAQHEAKLTKDFNQADINHDGKLSGTELSKLGSYAAKYEKNGELDKAGYEEARHDQWMAKHEQSVLDGPKAPKDQPAANTHKDAKAHHHHHHHDANHNIVGGGA